MVDVYVFWGGLEGKMELEEHWMACGVSLPVCLRMRGCS